MKQLIEKGFMVDQPYTCQNKTKNKILGFCKKYLVITILRLYIFGHPPTHPSKRKKGFNAHFYPFNSKINS